MERTMTKSTTTQAVGYVRVSTDDQADSGLSLEHQEARIRAYATVNGLELIAIVRDEGISAGKPLAFRKGGAAVLAMLTTGPARHLIALKLDRVFRNAADALNQAELWDKAGVGLHLIDMGGQSVNTRSAMGRMFFTMAAGFAELERGLIAERTASAMKVKKERLEVYSRPTMGFDAIDGRPDRQRCRASPDRSHCLRALGRLLLREDRGHAQRRGGGGQARWSMVRLDD
jgi:DNA invertase Pin-like site-specific DNA recombinase